MLRFSLSTALLYPSSPHFWNSFNRYYFFHLYTYVHMCFYSVQPPIPFPCHFHPPTGTTPPKTCSAFLYFDFVEEKQKK
jgi:hypothetical protein